MLFIWQEYIVSAIGQNDEKMQENCKFNLAFIIDKDTNLTYNTDE